ncbi:MAG: hypothetical protein K2J01_06800 [Clostridiales bacterium]|nr:hypothetical protein [Clostridiales bacterium]
MELGRLRIEYTQDNDVIQIFNSPMVCSLVINNKVVDEYKGAIAFRFTLKGTIEKENEKVQIEAKMGFCFMRLYYNGVLVSKKFMGFG